MKRELDFLKCPDCGKPTIPDTSEDLTFEEVQCDSCFALDCAIPTGVKKENVP